ncbi:MAG: hypothetical protein Kow00124_01690 [Anaerolineae bacterium]
MYTNNELLFPDYVIPLLRDMRGEGWRELVDSVVNLPAGAPEKLAFVLMMVRLNGCLECETDSYRAMRGCAMCATQTLRRYKGADSELLEAYHKALEDVRAFLEQKTLTDQQIA